MDVYGALLEEESRIIDRGWEKETIEYILRHKSRIYNQIRKNAKSIRHKIQLADVEDVYSEILKYLFSAADYDVSKAYEKSSANQVVSIEGYLNSCVRFCTLRFCTSITRSHKEMASGVIQSEQDNELSVLNSVMDENSYADIDGVFYDLEELCRSSEHERYQYGADIYLVWFLRLLAYDKEPEVWQTLLNVLEISLNELVMAKRSGGDGELMKAFARAIEIAGIERSIEIIRKYVYCADLIERVVRGMENGIG